MAGRITYTVTTTSGSRKHEITDDEDNNEVAASIRDAFAGLRPGFTLTNPTTLYSIANVISVSVEGGPPELLQQIKNTLELTGNNDK